MTNKKQVCECGHESATHDGGGYCSHPVEQEVCGCDRFTEKPDDKPALITAPYSDDLMKGDI